MASYQYRVQRLTPGRDVFDSIWLTVIGRDVFDPIWLTVIGSAGNRSYSTGWLHALASFYPRSTYRLVFYDAQTKQDVVVETEPGAEAPRPATAQ